MLLEADDHRAAAGVVIPHLATAQQRAPRTLAGAALAAGRQADRHCHRLAGFGARRIQDRLVGRLRAAALRTLVLVGMLVAILDAGVGRAAGLSTAVGFEAARRLEGTAGLELAAANTFRSGTAGIGVTTMAKTRISERGDGKRQRGRKTTEKQRTTHEVSLQKKRLAVTGGTAEGHSAGEAGMPPEASGNSGTRLANVKKRFFPPVLSRLLAWCGDSQERPSIKAPGGSRGTPGLNTTQRAMQIREEPNDPESPDFRPGLRGNIPAKPHAIIWRKRPKR